MFEKRLAAVPPQAFTANGTDRGVVTIANTSLFKVKQQVSLMASALPNILLEVKKIISPTQLIVGPISPDINSYQDISAYTTAQISFIFANEQKRPSIPFEEFMRAVYEEEPTVALRTMLVDIFGNRYTTSNPLPVQLSDGSINIGTVNAELEVALSHKDNDPDFGDVHDSVRIGDGIEELEINPDGSINVNIIQTPSATEATLNEYNEVVGVVAGVETVIVSIVLPANSNYQLQRAQFSGEQIAHYRLYVNNVCVGSCRTHHGSGLSNVIEFVGASDEGLQVDAGDTIELRVLHGRPGTGNFEGRIQIYSY
jgi:hypothetical protein